MKNIIFSALLAMGISAVLILFNGDGSEEKNVSTTSKDSLRIMDKNSRYNIISFKEYENEAMVMDDGSVFIYGDTLEVIRKMMRQLFTPVVLITVNGDTARYHHGDTIRLQECYPENGFATQ